MAQYSDPRTFTQYRIYMPGQWDIEKVLETVAPFVEGEPVIINTPALCGEWEVGYCNYRDIVRAAGLVDKWFSEAKNE